MRAHPPLRRSAADAAEEDSGREADLAEDRGEQRVVFETIPAAPIVEEFAFQRLERESDDAAFLNRYVLEQERFAMRGVQAPQGLGRHRQRPGHADAMEIIVQPHVASI